MLIYKSYVNNINIAFLVLITISLFSCKKLVEVEPPINGEPAELVFDNDLSAASASTGLLITISGGTSNPFTGLSSISVGDGLSADEFNLNPSAISTILKQLYSNSLAASPYWSTLYSNIFHANAIIEGLENATKLTPRVRNQLLGEAKFIRALCYFYLVEHFGDVPLVLSTDYEVNRQLGRNDVSEVYTQIVNDLESARNSLSDDFLDANITFPTVDRVRPNKWAATALLARIHLFRKEWIKAEELSTIVINNSAKFKLTANLDSSFLKNNTEAIWQLQPLQTGSNTEDAKVFILTSTGPNTGSRPVWLSQGLLSSFEPTDKRKVSWIKNVTVGTTVYYYSYKYKVNALNSPLTEHLTVLRLPEQFLIRAEARAHLGRVSEGLSDLNLVRRRVGLNDVSTTAPDALINYLIKERRVEFFGEWGHRWLDLKRTSQLDSLMNVITPSKGGNWNSHRSLFPIPERDMTLGPNLSPQNPGY